MKLFDIDEDTNKHIELDDAILRFATSMERKFNKTGKGDSYLSTTKKDLLCKFVEEFCECVEAVRNNKINKDEECIDVALMAMMLKENSLFFIKTGKDNKREVVK